MTGPAELLPEDGSVDTGNLKENARDLERQGRIRESLAMYRHVLTAAEGTPELLQELPLYVKAGDLYLKLDNPKAAVSMYERVGKIYAEHGSAKSVAAVCAKVLRIMPERTHVFQRLVRIMVGHGHVESARDVMVQWAEQARLDDTRRTLDGLADRSADEVLPVLLMLLELAERIDAAAVETVVVGTPVRSAAIAEIEEEPEAPAPDSEAPADVEISVVAGSSEAVEEKGEADERGDIVEAVAMGEAEDEEEVDEEEEADKKELTPATMGENIEFRSERFGAESLLSEDDTSEEAEAPVGDAGDLLGDLRGLDDLPFVPGDDFIDLGSPGSDDGAFPSGLEGLEPEGGAPEPGPEPEPKSVAGVRQEDRPEQLLEPEPEPRPQPLVLEVTEEPRPRPSPVRRSPVGSVLLATTQQEEDKSHWVAWAGGVLGVIVIVVGWIAFGIPPFGTSEAQVPDAEAALVLDDTGDVEQVVGGLEDAPAMSREAPQDTGLPATLEPNPALAVTPLDVPVVESTRVAGSDSSSVVAIEGLAILDVRAVTDTGLVWHEVRQMLAEGQEVFVRSFPFSEGPSEPEIDSADGTTTARLSMDDHLVVVSAPVSEAQVRLLIRRLSETRTPPN